jgi:hypothetical protein
VPFKVSKHSGLLLHYTTKLLATPHQMTALRQCSRSAPRSSIATVSADYLSLDLSLFILTLDDKINLKLSEYSRHELWSSSKDNLVDVIDKEQRCNASPNTDAGWRLCISVLLNIHATFLKFSYGYRLILSAKYDAAMPIKRKYLSNTVQLNMPTISFQ